VYCLALALMFLGTTLNFHMRSGRVVYVMAAAFMFVISMGGFFVAHFSTTSFFFAATLFCAAYSIRTWFPELKILRWLAAISYPLYVVHGIAGYVAIRVMLDYGVSPGLAVIFATGGAVAISTLLHYVVEMPTQRIGKQQMVTGVSGEL